MVRKEIVPRSQARPRRSSGPAPCAARTMTAYDASPSRQPRAILQVFHALRMIIGGGPFRTFMKIWLRGIRLFRQSGEAVHQFLKLLPLHLDESLDMAGKVPVFFFLGFRPQHSQVFDGFFLRFDSFFQFFVFFDQSQVFLTWDDVPAARGNP